MPTKTPVEDLLTQTLDRLNRQERRTEALEVAVLRGSSAETYRPAAETPPDIPWPRRELPGGATASPPPDRVAELEARLAEAEERLRVAARLETVGRLVAGVAHDFNNLLTVIVGHADVIRAGLTGGHHCETAERIAATAHTAAGVTRQLVAFSRPGSGELCPLDANVAVAGVQRTLRRLTGERVALEFLPAGAVPLVRIDPGQFDQVLLNLVVNARDAITGGGTITVRTAGTAVTAGRPGWPDDVPPGEFLAVTVTDTGCGMPPEVVARIFDPFFTTKGANGTGLGLSTVRDIVRASGGHVEVESAVGWGTSVRVFWPAH
jgi:two-component system cell cycle sensor histidine kinase/response regulator CckA